MILVSIVTIFCCRLCICTISLVTVCLGPMTRRCIPTNQILVRHHRCQYKTVTWHSEAESSGAWTTYNVYRYGHELRTTCTGMVMNYIQRVQVWSWTTYNVAKRLEIDVTSFRMCKTKTGNALCKYTMELIFVSLCIRSKYYMICMGKKLWFHYKINYISPMNLPYAPSPDND